MAVKSRHAGAENIFCLWVETGIGSIWQEPMAYVYNTSIASADTEEAFRASVAEVSDEGDSELTVKTQKK